MKLIFILLVSSCASQITPTVELISSPSDISAYANTTLNLSVKATTNSDFPIAYLWEREDTSGLSTLSNTDHVSIVTPSMNDICGVDVEVYHVTAFSGPIHINKTFSIQTINQNGAECVPPVTFDNTSSVADLELNVDSQISLPPLTEIQIKANVPAGANWKLTWQKIEANHTVTTVGTGPVYQYQAPALISPCDVIETDILLIAEDSKISTSRTVSIYVQNPSCNYNVGAATRLLLAENDDLYIGTENGLVRLRNGQTTTFTQAGAKRTLKAISALAEEPDHTIWVANSRYTIHGYEGEGIEQLDPNGDKWATNLIQEQIQGKLVTTMAFQTVSDVSDVWIGTKDTASDGIIWASGGLTLLSTDFTFSRILLEKESVFATILDQKGNRWIATGTEQNIGTSRGLLLYRNGSLVQQFDGSQWHGVGLTRLSDNRNIRALIQDAFSNIWIGLASTTFQGGGLVKYDGTNFSSSPILLPRSNDVRALTVDGNNDLWIATSNGLVRYAHGSFTTFTQSDGLASNDVRDVIYDRERNVLWAATAKGLTRVGVLK